MPHRGAAAVHGRSSNCPSPHTSHIQAHTVYNLGLSDRIATQFQQNSRPHRSRKTAAFAERDVVTVQLLVLQRPVLSLENITSL